MTDPTYNTESPRYPEVADRDARLVGHKQKGSKMTERVDRETVQYIRADLHQQAIAAAAYDDAKRYLTGEGVYAQWDRNQYPPEFLDWLKTLAEDIGDSCPKEAESALRQAIAEADARGYARAVEVAAECADNCVTQECCGCPRVVQISEDEGYEVCCGNTNVVPMYPNEIATAIRALAQKEGE